MAQAAIGEEDIPEGRVDKVCKEWLVREDNAVAYRLQDEEINQYYEGNRFKNQVFRSDLEKAKYLQEKEEFERLTEYERERERLAKEDERIAKEIQEELIEEERRKAEELSMIAEEDKRLAQRLQEKEKERLKRKKLQRERLQVEKIRLEKFGSVNPDLLNAVNRTIDDMDKCEGEPSGLSSLQCYSEEDLSEFCMKPPPGLTEEELNAFMAEQDEELARFLQQYESKRKNAILRDKKHWIEAQDYEIARILQEEEKARAKRARERARQMKAERERAKKAELEAKMNGNNATSLGDEKNGTKDDQNNQQQSKINHEPEIEETSLINPKPCESNHSQELDEDESESNDLAKRALPPIPSYHNVAMDLDPTYKRQRNPDSQQNELTGLHFAQLCRVSPCSSSSQSPTSSLKPCHKIDPEYDESLAYLAYQPVQGQRRISTAEKRTKKNRDACRTQ